MSGWERQSATQFTSRGTQNSSSSTRPASRLSRSSSSNRLMGGLDVLYPLNTRYTAAWLSTASRTCAPSVPRRCPSSAACRTAVCTASSSSSVLRWCSSTDPPPRAGPPLAPVPATRGPRAAAAACAPTAAMSVSQTENTTGPASPSAQSQPPSPPAPDASVAPLTRSGRRRSNRPPSSSARAGAASLSRNQCSARRWYGAKRTLSPLPTLCHSTVRCSE